MKSYQNHAVQKYFANTSLRLGWPFIICSLGLILISQSTKSHPLLLIFFSSCVFASAYLMDTMALNFYSLISWEEKKEWFSLNVALRLFGTVSFSGLITSTIVSEGLAQWGGLISIAAWAGGLESIASNSHPSPRIAALQIITLSLGPLVYIFAQGDYQHLVYGSIAVLYNLQLIPKIYNRYNNFCESCKLSESFYQEKKRIEGLMDMTPANVSWLDYNLNYICVNYKTADFLGLNKEDFIGKPFGFVTSLENIAETRKWLQEFLESDEKVKKSIISMRTRQGELHRHDVTIEKYYVEGQSLPQLVIMAIDIESHIQTVEALENEKLKQQHAARLASLGEMASGIAHEIKNPLAIISGANGLINHEVQKGSALRISKIVEKTEQIDRTLNRIVHIVEGMRKLSRSESAASDEWTKVSTIISETVSFCEEKLRMASVDLKIQMFISDMELYCQPTQLSQVLLNLISNAKDIIEVCEDRRIRVKVDMDTNGSLIIQVKDSGPGVANPDKLFTPFFTTKDPGKGTGLGLSISRQIIEAQSGQLVYLREDDMTIFQVAFPASRVRRIEKAQAA